MAVPGGTATALVSRSLVTGELGDGTLRQDAETEAVLPLPVPK